MKSGVERALFDAEHVTRDVLNPSSDIVAVGGSPGERLEDEEVEGALKEVERTSHVAFP